MASLALTVAGSALGGPVGATLGGLLGSYIDRTFIIPGLLGKPDIKGPSVGELRIQSVEEGAPANVVLGPETRSTGHVMWSSDYIVREITDEVGGKGGGQEVVTGHAVYISVALEIARNQIESLQKLWANGNVVYDADPDKGASSSLISFQKESNLNMDINSPPGGPDLSVFRSGMTMDVSGSSISANNGTFKVESSKKTPSGASRVRIRNPLGVASAAGPLIVLFQAVPKFNPEKVAAVSIYLGTSTQNPDPLIESYEGAGEVPAYRGIAYVVLKDLYCGDYGNQLPQFATLARESASMTSGDAISKIMQRAKGSGVTVLTSEATRLVAGYPITGLVPTAQALQPIQIAMNVLDQETDNGALRFFDREKAFVVDVPSRYHGAVAGGDDHTGDVKVTPDPKRLAPSEVHISYKDRDADYGNGNQSQNRPSAHFHSERLDFPLVLDGAGAEARMIARTILWLRDFDRFHFSLSLPLAFIPLLENDVIKTPVHGSILDLLIERADIGDDYMIELECVRDVREVLEQVGVADSPSAGGNTVSSPPNVLAIPINAGFGGTPAPGPAPGPGGGGGGTTSGGTADRPGYFLILLNTDDEDEWLGGVIYEKTAAVADDSFTRLMTVSREAKAGRCRTTLGGATYGVWDLKSVLTVEMLSGELESHPEDEVLSGFNRALVGGEVIGFMNATLVDTNTYEISGLLRGLRDSRDKIFTHAADEYFVYLNGGGIQFVEVTPSKIGVQTTLRGVAIGGSVEDEDDIPFTPTAQNLRPFPPANVVGTRSGDDVIVNWNRTTREICRLFGPKPIGEDFERYELDVGLDGGDVTLTVVVDDETSVTLDGPALEDAGMFPEDAVSITVYQISGTVGRGRGTEIVVPGAIS